MKRESQRRLVLALAIGLVMVLEIIGKDSYFVTAGALFLVAITIAIREDGEGEE